MTDDMAQAIIHMLEALRLEIRASALVQQRTEGAANELPAIRQMSDQYSRAAGNR